MIPVAWVASVRSLVMLRKADGWTLTVHGRGWKRQHIYRLGNLRVDVSRPASFQAEVNDTWAITASERSGSLRFDWLRVLDVIPRSVRQAIDYLAVADVVPVHMSSGYGIGAVEAINAAKEAMVQGLAPRLADAIREEISAVKL